MNVLGKRIVAIIFVIVNLIIFALCFLNNNIWYDETFTMALVQHSYRDIWSITAMDVHPPLYYFIVRSCMSIFGFKLYVARIVSLISFLLVLLVGITKIRKLFGDEVARIFVILCSAMPVMLRLELEARMYMWALLFILLVGLYAYEAITCNSKQKWIGLSAVSLLAAYTHYYALLAAGIIYIFVFAIIIFKHKKCFKEWLASGTFVFIGYIPWLSKLFNQMEKVSQDYWISKVSLKDLAKYIVYPFHIVEQIFPTAIVCILLLPILIIILKKVKEHYKSNEGIFGVLTFLLLIMIIAIGLGISITIKPIFIARYMSVALGLFWLGMAIFIAKCTEKLKLGIVFALFCILIIESLGQYAYENSKNSEMMMQLEKNMGKDASIIVSDTHSLGIASFYFDRNIVMLNKQKQLSAFEPQMKFASSEDVLKTDGEFYYIVADSKKVKKEFSEKVALDQDIEIEDHVYHIYKFKTN